VLQQLVKAAGRETDPHPRIASLLPDAASTAEFPAVLPGRTGRFKGPGKEPRQRDDEGTTGRRGFVFAAPARTIGERHGETTRRP
jgi:hypothetical protein